MNTREMTTSFFQETSSVGSLFRALWRVLCDWTSVRIAAYRYKKLDFRELREDEVSDEIRMIIEEDRHAPDEDFVNL